MQSTVMYFVTLLFHHEDGVKKKPNTVKTINEGLCFSNVMCLNRAAQIYINGNEQQPPHCRLKDTEQQNYDSKCQNIFCK